MPEEKKRLKPHPLFAAVENTIYTRRMLQQGDSVLVGVSGGADSVALLHILLWIAPGLRLNVGIAHLNHALREDASDRDAQFVKSLAQKLNLPCHIARRDVEALRQQNGGSIEETGRRTRYQFYMQTAEKHGFDKIALGHHADDSAELVMMNLLRGSGPRGVSGIPPVRGINVIRPLIDVRRRDILSFIYENSLQFVVDASNQDLRFLRNRVRHKLIPELTDAYNPKFTETLVRIASITRTEEEWIEKMVEGMLETATLRMETQRIILSMAYLSCLHPAAVRRVVRGALERVKGNLNHITFQHVDAIANLILRGSDPGELHLPDRLLVRRQAYRLAISKEKRPLGAVSHANDPKKDHGYRYDIHEPGTGCQTLLIRETGQQIIFCVIKRKNLSNLIITGQESAFFDMEKLDFPLKLRNFQPGDRFFPLGMKGSQKVKKYFINAKVARGERKTSPILLSRGKIIWVVGRRADERYKISPATRYILKAEFLLA